MLQPRTILDPAVKSGCGYVIGLARWYCHEFEVKWKLQFG
jgi:hypothetical protein